MNKKKNFFHPPTSFLTSQALLSQPFSFFGANLTNNKPKTDYQSEQFLTKRNFEKGTLFCGQSLLGYFLFLWYILFPKRSKKKEYK